MSKPDHFGEAYLRLALEIDKHINGYIDAYIGPAELREEVDATPKQEPADLLEALRRLEDELPDVGSERAAYLRANLRAMDCTIRKLAGETFDYLDEVARLFDVQPARVDESVFTRAHRELDALLPAAAPGQSLNERREAWRQHYVVGDDSVMELIDLARAETRRRTLAMFALPEDEDVTVRLTKDQPWGAYNYYLGQARSLIEFNTDIPIFTLGLLDTFAHEGYPGHHTEAALKERLLYHEKGYAEQAVLLIHSPAAVISEGIATTAAEIIFPDGATSHDWNVEVMLPAAGIEPFAGETADDLRRKAQAAKSLGYVSANAAMLYHTGELTREQTIDYIQTYGLVTPERAAKSFSFISHPLWRAYVFTYTQGYDLLARSADRPAAFRRALTGQVLPSTLAAA